MSEGGSGTFTQNPAGTSFSVLYGRVANYIMGPSDGSLTPICKEGIWSGLKRVNTANWNWARAKTDVTLTASQQEYSLNGAFREMRALELLNASGRPALSLSFVDAKSWDALVPNRVDGDGSPTVATIFNEFDNGLITLNLPPSAGFIALYPTMRGRYYRRIPLPSGDNSLCEVPSEVEEFLTWHGRAVAAAHFVPQKVAYAEQKANEWWRDLRRANTLYGTAAWNAW